jgi:hypothetical protein
MADFTPSTTPGCRVPFQQLPDGRPIYDAFGPGYTLLRGDPDAAVAAFVDAMRGAGVPLEVVDMPIRDQEPYDRKLILVRTDQHVVWRGDAIPDRPEDLIDTLRGRARNVMNRAAA